MDTPVRKVLLGIAVAYTVLIVVVPFLNVFLQVSAWPTQLINLPHCTSVIRNYDGDDRIPTPVMDRQIVSKTHMQAFGNGFGPFLEHLADEDFLHAVSCSLFDIPLHQNRRHRLATQEAMAYTGRRQSHRL